MRPFEDIFDGIRQWETWVFLAWYDILARYRRSVLGPLWHTLSAAIFIGFLGFMYSYIMNQPAEIFVPHLAIGYLVWITLSGIMIDGTRALIDAQNILLQRNLPISIHIFRPVWRNIIVFFHNIIIFLPIAVYFSINPGWAILVVPVGLILIFLNGAWIAMFLAIISARYRDVPPLVATLVSLVFFMTPVIWLPESMDRYKVFVDVNVFYHLIELIRAPLQGNMPSTLTWSIVSAMTVGGWGITLLLFSRTRDRIVFWL